MLLSTVMIVSLLPTAALAADGQMQTAQDLSANAVTAVAAKTAEAEAFEKEMEAFRSGMEKALKDPGAKKLTELAANIGLVTDKWKDATATEGTDYNYDVVSNTLSVSTAAGLAWMAKQVNADSLVGTAVTLADDIDLSGKLWIPAQNFTGTFDGQGHTISGLTINNEVIGSKLEYLGLFRNIAGTADKHSFVKNVTFENVTVYAPSFLTAGGDNIWPYFGTVAGYSDYTDYENITVTGTVTIYADYAAAGIVMAKDDSTGNSFRGCKVDATVYSVEDFYGVVGYVDADTLIEDCSVSGSFYTKSEFAGIVYEAKGGVTIRSCSVRGDLYADDTAYGICYELGESGEEDEQNVMADCSVALSAWVDSSFFGLTGSTNGDSTTTDCHVSGTFYIDSEFCGLMEYLYGGGTVQDCSVSGKVYAGYMMEGGMDELYGAENTERAAKVTRVRVDLTAYAEDGGICGLTDETLENVVISDCNFAGTYYVDEDYFAGIVGETTSSGSLTMTNCKVTAEWLGQNVGSTSGYTYFSGLVGNVDCNDLTITDCSVTGDFYMAPRYDGYGFYLGGLVGDASDCDGTVEITNSSVTGDMLCVAESIGELNVGGLIGGYSGWSADKLNIENCHFKGNLIAKATKENAETNVERIGALAACIGANDLAVKNCTAESRIVLDGRCGGGATNHAGAMFGGLKRPGEATVSDCSFTGDVTVLGKEDALFDNNHFGMIVGEDCASKLNLSNITVNGDYYAEYAKSSYFGGGIGHRCCDNDLTANKVTINTDITMKNSGSVADVGGFIGNAGGEKLTATDCAYNGDITIEMNPPEEGGSFNYIEQLGGFLGDNVGETTLSHCSHTGNISVNNAIIDQFGGFAAYTYTSDRIEITDSYTFGDIMLTGSKLDSRYGGGQWIGQNSTEDITVKNCYSVGDITVTAQTGDGAYIGNAVGWAYEPIIFDNYYHAGTLTVNSTGGTPDVGYLTGNADELCKLTNVYYDKECFANSTLNGTSISLAKGDSSGIFETVFVPLATAQMQANRYASDESYKKLNGSPAVADPHWDYLNGEIYANEIDKKAALVDALNAGKDGYLNWRVDGTSFRGYPFFGQSWTILYYADHGSGNELLHIEQFDKTGVTAKEVPVPDQTLYPNSAYEWQDQNGLKFTEKTVLNGDKFVYAQLVSYYTVQYVTNYPDNLTITPSDHDILENNYISGATVTVRSNNTFTVPDGYRFKEWNTQADGNGTKVDAFSTQEITDKNLVFYAIWEPLPQPTYSVYYVANGGNGDMWDALEYHSGDTVTVKDNEFVHPEGLKFTGFLEYETGTTYQPGGTFEITRDTYLIAQWKVPEQTFSVTYLAGGGEGSMTDDTAYKSGESATVQANTFTNEGYEFAGFVDLDNNHYKGDGTEEIAMTKDVVLVAQWTPVKYTVTYHGNGAAEQDVVDGGYLYNTPVTIRDGEFTFTKENSTFLYWSLTPDGEKAYDAYAVVNITEDIELYAIWDTVTPGPTYSITYKGNGAVEQNFTDGGYAEGTTATIKNGSVFTRSGYTFQYWSFSASGEKAYDAYDRVTMDHDITLYAIWSKDNSSSGGSSGGGGSSTPSSGTVNIIKTDSVDKHTYLSGAKFQIYTIGDKFIGTYTTNEDGQITISDLANGRYYAVEVTPPKGYTLDSSKHEFIISGGKTTVLALTNERTGVPDMLNGDDHFAYIIGRSDGLVHPDAPITRAEVTTIFFRLLAPTVRDANLSYTNTFSDVNADLWCNTAISTMTKLGIVHGRTASTFDPNAFITRAEFAAIAARFDKSSVSQLANFSDISGHWAALEISKAAANGWVNGYSDGTFKPDRNITRAEAMALINRVLNRVPETVNDLLPDMVTWPDNMNTSAWCYLDVQEATNSHDYERKSNGCETWTKLTKVPDWKIYEN